MGRAKEVHYMNDRYSGDMSQEQCDKLEEVIQFDEDNGEFTDLKHIIFNMADSDVNDLIDDYTKTGWSFREFDKPLGTLRSEQTIGVAFMYIAKKCILGDSVGMGKTVMTAGLVNLLSTEAKNFGKKFRCLVLTEKNSATQFRAEMVKFTGEYTRLIQSGEKDVVSKFIMNNPPDTQLDYNIVGTHALLTTPAFISWMRQAKMLTSKMPFDLLVIDESSVLGSSKSQVSDGFMSIAKDFDRIVFLNATPFETKLDVFYNQLNALDPKLLPTKSNFTSRYVVMDYRGMYPKPSGRYKNQEEFKRLIRYRYFARTRRDKGAIQSDCDGRLIMSSLSEKQKELMKRTVSYKFVYDCPTYLDHSIEFNSENVPKLASLRNLLREECADAESVLIYTYHKEPQRYLREWLEKLGYSCRVLNGDTSDSDRFGIINGFKNGAFQILITNVQKGLNFGKCDYCIFYSFNANPSAMIQLEGRITRSFDLVGKHVYILCSSGREYKELTNVVRARAKATQVMASTDFSVVLDILLGEMK